MMRIGVMVKAALGAAALTASCGASAQLSLQASADPAAAAAEAAAEAESIRGLNIMLMVTSLRCRSSAHDFRSEYEMFTRTHAETLANAHRDLRRALIKTHGEDGGRKALDRIGVRMANRYGDGHRSLGCKALKQATLDLLREPNGSRLGDMAARFLNEPARSARLTNLTPPKPTLRYDLGGI